MSDAISHVTEVRACELVDSISHEASAEADKLLGGFGWKHPDPGRAVAARLQAFSDAAKAMPPVWQDGARVRLLDPFILPDPVDPLAEVFSDMSWLAERRDASAANLREELAKCGLQIVPVAK